MKFLLYSSLLLLSGTALHAQTAIKGFFLVNRLSKAPVPDGYVQNPDRTFNTYSDANGFVSFKQMTPALRILHISRIGFESITVDVSNLPVTTSPAIIYVDPIVSGLEEVTVVSSGSNSVFKTISELDIHLRPVNNSQEVLRMVPGLFIGQHAGGGKSEQIFLRGFDIDHGTDINLSVDGLPVNMVSHAHGQGYADLHWLIPELIEKVNFNKGPYYADKGNFTTTGFVEFKTKDFLEKNFLKGEVGQFGTFRGLTGLNLLKSKQDKQDQSLYVAGEASFTRGFFESPQNFNRFNVFLKYRGSISSRTTLTAIATSFNSKWNASGQIPERAVEQGLIGFYGAIDNTEGGETSRYNANLEATTVVGDGGVIRNQLYFSKNAFRLYSNFTFFKEDPINGDQIRQSENRNMMGYNTSFQKDYYLANIKTQTKIGVQLRYDEVNEIELTRTKNRATVLKRLMLGDIDELNAGAFLAQKLSVIKHVDLTGGVRVDYFKNRYHDQLTSEMSASKSFLMSPKLSLDVIVNDKLRLYFYNGKGFHSNDTRVAVRQNGRKVSPPAWGSDIGAVFKIGKKVLFQSALWHLWLDQEFIYVGDEGVVEPGGQTRRFGFDLSIRYEMISHLFADFDITLANARALQQPKAQGYLPLSPGRTSVGGLTYKKQYGFNGSIRYRYMGDRPANEDRSSIAKGYFVSDLAINYTKVKWEAGLAIQNLFNARWKETQFEAESRLQHELYPVSEIHFTPGSPFFARAAFSIFF